MRTLITLAAVVVLATSGIGCDSSQGSNSANALLPFANPVSPTMLEAKGGNANGKGNISPLPPTSLTLEIVTNVGASDVSYGDTVKFNVAPSTSGLLSLNCYQGSSWVYAAGGYPSGSEFILAANSWQSGAADCTAKLFTTTDGTRENTLAAYSFHVAE